MQAQLLFRVFFPGYTQGEQGFIECSIQHKCDSRPNKQSLNYSLLTAEQGLTCQELRDLPEAERSQDGINRAAQAAKAAKEELAKQVEQAAKFKATIRSTRLERYYAEAWEKAQTLHKVMP